MKKNTGMIDISDKEPSKRAAKASAFVRLDAALLDMVRDNTAPKGNVIEAARIAGIMAAKNTPDLIPLCHPIEVTAVSLAFSFKDNGVHIISHVYSTAKTGVEMEAMVACSIAALTIYDMLKMFNKAIDITDIILLEKQGGKSGIYQRGES